MMQISLELVEQLRKSVLAQSMKISLESPDSVQNKQISLEHLGSVQARDWHIILRLDAYQQLVYCSCGWFQNAASQLNETTSLYLFDCFPTPAADRSTSSSQLVQTSLFFSSRLNQPL
ncbi:hypothetical protein F511_42729 [Dorcoceras hygrometricum]|uniref:Uncharacterized protein n=1 Tax=Dorcoceras hygrometricum TaxID=472368 RepID=A0A2Z6ZZ92_9LAMI|nr:hypothetical protein F511_42729 [Dorcoceras hygrometricum]